jgi:hypothetical protein
VFPRFAFFTSLTIVCFGLTAILLFGCTSAEQQRKDREVLLENFVSKVALHLLDRNPSTMEQSVRLLMKEELSEQTCSRLQDQHLIPESPLDIMKVVYAAQKTHQTNVVKVESVKATGPIEKDIVPFRVSGKDITKTPGKPDQTKGFAFNIAVKLTDEMSGYPKVVDVEELPTGKTALKPRLLKLRRRA